MNNISFNEQPIATRQRPQKKTFADRLIGWGIVKNRQQADIVLILVIIIGFGITFYNLSNTFSTPVPIEDEATI